MFQHKQTYSQLVRSYYPYFTQHAPGQELAEIRQLIASVLDSSIEEVMRWELCGEYVPEEIHTRLEPLIQSRMQGVPLQHLTGRVYFCNREFYVEAGVFIPRPETELLAEWMQEKIQRIIQQTSYPVRVLDLCSGSGVLAIMAACHGAQVTAVEINTQAIALAKRNENKQNLRPGTINWIESDIIPWLENTHITSTGEQHKYEIVVANPPYIPLDTPVSTTVAYDPTIAVFSGVSGFDCISTILPRLSPYFTQIGHLGIEHDISHSQMIAQQMEKLGYYDITLHSDFTGRARFTTATYRDNHLST